MAQNAPQNRKNHHISETNRAWILIFVHIPEFCTSLGPLMLVSNISNYWLPQNMAPVVPKWVPKPPKMGKMTIFEKLIGLERSFLFLYNHLPPQ